MSDASRRRDDRRLALEELLTKRNIPCDDKDVEDLIGAGYYNERLLSAATMSVLEGIGLSKALAGLLVMEFGAGAAESGMRRRPHSKRPIVAYADRAVPDVNLYLPPAGVEQYVQRVRSGDFFLLTGHRQAGKTTIGHAVEAKLREYAGCCTSLVTLTQLRQAPSAECVFKEILDDLGQPRRTEVTARMQLRQLMKQPSAPFLGIIFDESDAIELLDDEQQANFLEGLRDLKQIGNAVGCVLIGTPRLERLVEEIAVRMKFSPFSAVPVTPARFMMADTEQLVQQLVQGRKEACMLISQEDLAASIHNLTDGHKGLTGVCLYQLDQLIGAGQPITASTWAEVEADLPFWLGTGGIPTYHKLVQDLVKIQTDPGVQRIMQGMLHNEGVYELSSHDLQASGSQVPAHEQLVWDGIVISEGANRLRISSPLLLNALIIAARTRMQLGNLPERPQQLSSWSVGQWALEQGIRHMPRVRLRQAEMQKKHDLQPDEWGLSYDIGHTMDEALSCSNWGSAYVCLPGCRIPEAAGASSASTSTGSSSSSITGKLTPAKRGKPKMLDWFFRNGQLPKVLFEIMVMTRQQVGQANFEFKRHHRTSLVYAQSLGAPCFLVNLAVMPEPYDSSQAAQQVRTWGTRLAGPRSATDLVQQVTGVHDASTVLSAQGLKDLQMMLDMYPPYLDDMLKDPATGNILVWGVDVLIIPHENLALMRNHKDIMVKRVDMEGSAVDEMLRFEPVRLSRKRSTFMR